MEDSYLNYKREVEKNKSKNKGVSLKKMIFQENLINSIKKLPK